MRVPSFPMIASFVLFAAPAFAQTTSMTGGQLSDSPLLRVCRRTQS